MDSLSDHDDAEFEGIPAGNGLETMDVKRLSSLIGPETERGDPVTRQSKAAEVLATASDDFDKFDFIQAQ